MTKTLPQLQAELDEAHIRLQVAHQTIDEIVRGNLEIKANIVTLQNNFQSALKQQSDTIVKLTADKKELENKLNCLDAGTIHDPVSIPDHCVN